MKKYKVFMTMEITADCQDEDEESAVERVRKLTHFGSVRGIKDGKIYYAENIKVKRYWGGGKEVKDEQE